ncbi:MAG: hypothetical protein HUK20_13365 [Fibrobacter sp.]|nr:hypothetical protein [Fibrobacter sp.]
MKGLTPIRTGRLVSAFFAFIGMILLFLNRVLSAVLEMAGQGVQMGLSRYDNFTGRFALDNFPEDRELMALLKQAADLLPVASDALAFVLFLSIVCIVVAVAGFVMPRNVVHILVALKILKWTGDYYDDDDGNDVGLTDAQKKITISAIGGVCFLVILAVCIVQCHENAKESAKVNYVSELEQQALLYINTQKAFFAKNKNVGTPKQLKLPDSLETEAFKYKVSSARFLAVSKIPMENCPEGSKWNIYASKKGFFTQELQLARVAPKDPACAKLTPDFKKIGRPVAKKAESKSDSTKTKADSIKNKSKKSKDDSKK